MFGFQKCYQRILITFKAIARHPARREKYAAPLLLRFFGVLIKWICTKNRIRLLLRFLVANNLYKLLRSLVLIMFASM